VLSKPVILRGTISTDGSPGRCDLSLGDQLRQRAAMGGEKERAELKAFEDLLAKALADALVSELRERAAGAVRGVIDTTVPASSAVSFRERQSSNRVFSSSRFL
jgi:hypothetical protein